MHARMLQSSLRDGARPLTLEIDRCSNPHTAALAKYLAQIEATDGKACLGERLVQVAYVNRRDHSTGNAAVARKRQLARKLLPAALCQFQGSPMAQNWFHHRQENLSQPVLSYLEVSCIKSVQ